MVGKINLKTLPDLHGAWIIQLDDHMLDTDITTAGNPMFWVEKRISRVTLLPTHTLIKVLELSNLPRWKRSKLNLDDKEFNLYFVNLAGVYYSKGIYSPRDFVDYYNLGISYTTTYSNLKEPSRTHRLLTSKELEFLLPFITNYQEEKLAEFN